MSPAAKNAQVIAVPTADEPEAVVLNLEDPLRPGRRRVGQGREARFDEAGWPASGNGGAPEHVAYIPVERASAKSTIMTRVLRFIFYPILGRQRFDGATFAGPPNVLPPTVRAMRVRKGIGKSLYFVPFDLNARRELAPPDRTFYEEHAHCPMPVSPWLRSWSYGRSAVNISSLANGALGEHRRHDTDGMRLEIAAPECRSSVRRSTEPTFGSSGSGAHSRAAGRC